MSGAAQSIEESLAALPTVGSINIIIRDGVYIFYASRRLSIVPLNIHTVEARGNSFDSGAAALIAAFG